LLHNCTWFTKWCERELSSLIIDLSVKTTEKYKNLDKETGQFEVSIHKKREPKRKQHNCQLKQSNNYIVALFTETLCFSLRLVLSNWRRNAKEIESVFKLCKFEVELMHLYFINIEILYSYFSLVLNLFQKIILLKNTS